MVIVIFSISKVWGKKMDKISIIVPIYNGASNLERCINSIMNQTYPNLEIILVNDGSTDASLSLCVDYAQRDKRVKLVNQQNMGRNIARNHGMEVSTGDFISFVDQDDFLDVNYFYRLYEQTRKFNSDIAICDCRFCDYDHPGLYYGFPSSDKDAAAGVYSVRKWMTKYGEFYRTIMSAVIVTWAKIIRQSCIHGVKFPSDRSLAEDMKTMWKFYLNAKRISFQTNRDYTHQKNPDSVRKLALEYYGSVDALEKQIAFLSYIGINVTSYYPTYHKYVCLSRDYAKQLGDVSVYNNMLFKLYLYEKWIKQ